MENLSALSQSQIDERLAAHRRAKEASALERQESAARHVPYQVQRTVEATDPSADLQAAIVLELARRIERLEQGLELVAQLGQDMVETRQAVERTEGTINLVLQELLQTGRRLSRE